MNAVIDYDSFSEEARYIEEQADSHQEIVDELRGSRKYRDALLEQGWHKENTGISVQSKRYWEKKRSDAVDTHHFDYLLRDIMEAELVFWKHYHRYSSDEEFIDDVENGDTGLGSEENIVKTWKWLTETLDAPDELESQQQRIGDL